MVVLDGDGTSSISTTVPFYDHMLTAFAKHSLIDLTIEASGDRIRFTPPASAKSLSRVRRLRHARWTATSDDEQAVSTVTAGPSSPKV